MQERVRPHVRQIVYVPLWLSPCGILLGCFTNTVPCLQTLLQEDFSMQVVSPITMITRLTFSHLQEYIRVL